MAALVDYTALTDGSLATGSPMGEATPFDGIKKDYWVKIHLDFTVTSLTDGDWAKFYDIPAGTFIDKVICHVVAKAAGDLALCIGDTNGDHANEWIADIDDDTDDVAKASAPGDTNGVLGGVFYPIGGGLYISSTVDNMIADILDIYVHVVPTE
jgi:hypothetical protein